MDLSEKFKQRVLESARLAGEWYTNNQNTEEHPWGGMHDSADLGRFMYEYFRATGWCRAMGVWGQAVGIMGLLTLAGKNGASKYRKAAVAAGEYLKSLQIVNPSDERSHGGLREHTPQTPWSYPRDAATGGMGFAALFKETGSEEYLERAKWFAEWYHRFGSDKDGWPYTYFEFQKGKGGYAGGEVVGEENDAGREHVKGDWQAGGGLVYWQLYKLTGEKKWLGYFEELIDPLVGLYEKNAAAPILLKGFHGEVEISYGNDDFAIIALVCAYRQWQQDRVRKALQHHMRRLWSIAADDGSYPSFAGTFVCNLNNCEYLQLCREAKLDEDLPALEGRIVKSAEFGLSLQETLSENPRMYGGFYGQSQFGVSRDRIHHRDAGYSLILHLRLAENGLAGPTNPYYSAWGWEK